MRTVRPSNPFPPKDRFRIGEILSLFVDISSPIGRGEKGDPDTNNVMGQ